MPNSDINCNRNYMNTLEEFCKSFASYVTGNWRENHLNIYVYLDEIPVRIACYGLGKVSWLGESNEEYPFHISLQNLVAKISEVIQEIHVEFNCGKMYKVNLRTE